MTAHMMGLSEGGAKNMSYSVSGMSCGSGTYSAISIGTTDSPSGHGTSNGAQISSVKNGSCGNGAATRTARVGLPSGRGMLHGAHISSVKNGCCGNGASE